MNRYKYIISAVIIIIISAWLINATAIAALITWLSILVGLAALMGIVVGGLFIYLKLATLYEHLLILRVERIKTQCTTIITARPNEQILIREKYLTQQPAGWQVFDNRQIISQIEPLPLSLPEPTLPLPPILPVLVNAQRAIIAGPSGSGKSTLLQHLIHSRKETSKIILIDPHGQRPKYGTEIDARGCGLNWTEIYETLETVLLEMTSRYQDIKRGAAHRSHSIISLFIDELMAIMDVSQRGDDAKRAAVIIKILATQARKAGIDVFLLAHSLRVGQTGLKGANDLLSNFTVVELHNENGTRKSFLHKNQPDSKKIVVEYSLPGLFTERPPLMPNNIFTLPTAPSKGDMRLIEEIKKGGSLADISRRAGISVCGTSNQRIRTLSKLYHLEIC